MSTESLASAPPRRGPLAATVDWLHQQVLVRPAGTPALAAALFAAGTVLVFGSLLGHDVGWFYYKAQRLLEGAQMYADGMDMNLPLIVYVNLPPAWLAAVLALPSVPVLQVYLLGLVAGALALNWHVLTVAQLLPNAATRRFFFLAALAQFFPLFDFGQREHLVLMFVLPYVVAAAARAEGRRLPPALMALVGTLAGVGLALKPHFLLAWLAVEFHLASVLRDRAWWRRPEALAVIVVGALHGATIVLLTPDYFAVARIALATYGAFDAPLAALLFWPVSLLVFMVTGLWLGVRRRSEMRALGDCLAVASVGFELAALIQRKGWGYQFYPAGTLAMLLTLVAGFALAQRTPAGGRLLRWSAAGVGLALVVVLLGSATGQLLAWATGGPTAIGPLGTLQNVGPPSDVRRLLPLVQAYAHRGDSVYFFVPGVSPAFPIVNLTETRWPVRFQHLWPLPGVYQGVPAGATPFPYHPPNDMDAIERFVFESTIADLLQQPPVLVIVDTAGDKQGFGETTFDYLEYFGQDPTFAAFWSAYRPAAVEGHYRLYVRR